MTSDGKPCSVHLDPAFAEAGNPAGRGPLTLEVETAVARYGRDIEMF